MRIKYNLNSSFVEGHINDYLKLVFDETVTRLLSFITEKDKDSEEKSHDSRGSRAKRNRKSRRPTGIRFEDQNNVSVLILKNTMQ